MTMPDTIVKLTVGFRPEGGAPEPLLIQNDREARLVFDAVTPDDNAVVAVVKFTSVLASRFGYPNDEALPGHPLYANGIDHHWIYEVLEPSWLEQIKTQNAVSFPVESRWSQRHFIVTFKDSTFECLADDYQVTTRSETLARPSRTLSGQRLDARLLCEPSDADRMFDMDSSQDANGVVILQLTADEALVLFEWIHRNEDESVDLASAGVTHPAERTVLWDLSACLEAILVRPFSADYSSEIAGARFRVASPPERDDLATPLES